MEICYQIHEEIVHNSKNCPLCEALDRISNLEDQIQDLKNERTDLKYEISTMQNENERGVA